MQDTYTQQHFSINSFTISRRTVSLKYTEEKFKEAVKNAENKEVVEFMSVDIQPIHVTDELITIAGIAIAHNTIHIPIVDQDNKPIGIISRRGMKHILAKYLDIEIS